MKYWPVPHSHSKTIPVAGRQGSFWEDRGDRRHCGIDIYAPAGSDVLSIEDGEIVDTGVFTSPDMVPYWNITSYVMIRNRKGSVCRYAELGDVVVFTGEPVKAGQLIGHVGTVLNPYRITEDSPPYIRKISGQGNHSMLHFELYKSHYTDTILTGTINYSGGNWFGGEGPENLLDPTDYLLSILGTQADKFPSDM